MSLALNNPHAILLPLLAQVALTALVWGWMYFTRIRHMWREGIRAQELARQELAQRRMEKVAGPSENLVNLLEIPLLFYVVLLLIDSLHMSNSLIVMLAWSYVALRLVHSLIHITSNRVLYRFTAYFTSTLLLWWMWGLVALRIVSAY